MSRIVDEPYFTYSAYNEMCIRDRVYTVYNQYLKRYTACQVAYLAPPDSVSKPPWAVILSLDWVGDAPLTAEELPHLRPLYKDFMYWPRDLHLLRVPVEVPPQYTLVGTLPPFTDQPCRSYGSWSDGYDVYLQIRLLVTLHGLLEGPPPFLRDGLWSSSGRGVKYVSAEDFRTAGDYPTFERWVANMIYHQGGRCV